MNARPFPAPPLLPNRLLMSLCAEDRAAMMALLQPVPLRQAQVLHRQGEAIQHVYFLQGGLVSLIRTMSDSSTIEVQSIGHEGAVGLTVVLGSDRALDQAIVRIEGPDALRMPVASLREECARRPALNLLMQRALAAAYVNTAQSVACSALHDVEQRCCRRLLMIHDRLVSHRLPLTHEFLALVLGVRRPSVTLAIQALKAAGVLDGHRGEIVILDTARMEQRACECYKATKLEQELLLPSPA